MELVRKWYHHGPCSRCHKPSGYKIVHLSDGKTLKAVAIVSKTGSKYRPPVKMLAETLLLGLPTDVTDTAELTQWADQTIIDQCLS